MLLLHSRRRQRIHRQQSRVLVCALPRIESVWRLLLQHALQRSEVLLRLEADDLHLLRVQRVQLRLGDPLQLSGRARGLKRSHLEHAGALKVVEAVVRHRDRRRAD